MDSVELEFHFQDFDGPMDLLVYLIEKDRIDIYDIPIASLTDQFLSHLEEAQSMNLEVTSSFLLFAARLVSIKVRLLLPKRAQDPEEDPRQELVDRIILYRFYREAVDTLENLAEKESLRRPKPADVEVLREVYGKPPTPFGLSAHTLWELAETIFTKMEEPETTFEIDQSGISLEWMMQVILEASGRDGNGVTFQSLMAQTDTREDVIALFLALLECLRLNQIETVQIKPFEDIRIFPVAS